MAKNSVLGVFDQNWNFQPLHFFCFLGRTEKSVKLRCLCVLSVARNSVLGQNGNKNEILTKKFKLAGAIPAAPVFEMRLSPPPCKTTSLRYHI
jgi:hypothetical protein